VKSTKKKNVKEVVPFFHVHDMERSMKFYVDGLGFVSENEWKVDGQLRWCRIELGKAALMLQVFTDAAPRELGNGVSLSFTCKNALAIHKSMQKRGLTPAEPFVGNGMWVVGITDPDGYKLEFQSETDAPEESTLSSHLTKE